MPTTPWGSWMSSVNVAERVPRDGMRARLRTRLVLFLASLLTPLACADHIARDVLLERIQAGTAPAIVDVRSAGEYEESHVPGAVNVPFYSLLSASDRIPESTEGDEPIVLYCEHGPRAGIARAQLWFASDRPVLFVEGHMTSWKQDELPVESAIESGAE